MDNSGRQRFEKAGNAIYFPSKIKIHFQNETGQGAAFGETPENMEIIIRKALMCDVKSLYNLFSEYSKIGEMLPRSMSDIYEHLRDFYIAEVEKTGEKGCNETIGACALSIVWENLAEIRSLAVKKPYTRKLIGTALIDRCIEEAKFFKINKIFALTYKPDFFKKSGFKAIDKSGLPHKIWSACISCVKFPDCDETAVMLEL